MLRLKEFPRGLGKGYDAALLGAWLDVLMGAITDEIPDTRYGLYLWHKYCLFILQAQTKNAGGLLEIFWGSLRTATRKSLQ